ncbi:MAG: hypothetical protein ACRECW_19245 [Phyllobacterium sp.]
MGHTAFTGKIRQGSLLRLDTSGSVMHWQLPPGHFRRPQGGVANIATDRAPSRSSAARLSVARLGLLMSTSVGALLIADPGLAQVYTCTNNNCQVPAGTNASSASIIRLAGTGDKAGDDAPSYTLSNYGNLTTINGQNAPLILRLQGGPGDDGTPGGWGGAVTLKNYGVLTFRNTTIGGAIVSGDGGGAPGIWDDTSVGYGMYGVSAGGPGGDQDAGLFGDGWGGNGGNGSNVTIANDGTVTLDNTWTRGASGIYAGSIAREGGDQDGTLGGNVKGGKGGYSGEITINNSGLVDVSGTVASGATQGYRLWGIGTESIGGNGGSEAADGGQAWSVLVNHSGTINVNARNVQGVEFGNGIAGIRVRSTGGDGSQSDDNSDPGGRGNDVESLTINSSGHITVTAEGIVNPSNSTELSGGIVALGQGGRGGNSPMPDTGSGHPAGDGGSAVSSNAGSSLAMIAINMVGGNIASTGNYLNGIIAYGRGGDGGTGRAQANAGSGGNGIPVTITTSKQMSISTAGDEAVGISAQSLGGTGGYQDPNGDGTVDLKDPRAGAGGDGGSVNIKVGMDAYSSSANGGTIMTNGHLSHGIRAQSFGGVGGDSGSSFILVGYSSSDAGGGGNGASVNVINASDITTRGDFSVGILAQSIGGGGGDVDPSVGLISVAGDAEQGGNGGRVTAELYGDITTYGEGSIGILAQSIGGGGGNGGSTLGVASVGGKGGAGGAPDDVTLTIHEGARVQTEGDFAYGLVGQSISEGGGNGGSVLDVSAGLPAVGIGGQAGNGGHTSGTVTVTVDAGVQNIFATTGDNAHAIVAQSIGGGGGTGGNAFGADVGIGDFQMAGGAGYGGPGGQVSMDLNTLTITTGGAHASGIMAQSIGGGGGTGGSAAGFDADLGLALSASVGGSGNTGGDGNKVAIVLTDSAITTGSYGIGSDITDMHGIVAQSIGGGGGAAGSAASKAVAVAIPSGETGSYGAEATFSAGGSGGSGGYGGEVDITLQNTDVITFADNSMGLIAQSIGGGGGLAGSGSAGGGVIGEGPETKSANLNMSLGGSGGKGQGGGMLDLTLANGSTITTYGNFSNAILGHTIGGGGGNAGSASSSSENFEAGINIGVNVGLGGKGGSGGGGGAVQFDLAGGTSLTTYGQGARGALLQSVGGGGGSSQGLTLGLSLDVLESTADLKIGRNGPNGGNGGAFESLDLGGTIRTYGADADGVLAQSIGGGGGIGGSVGGASADSEGILFEINDIESDISSPFDARVSIGGAGGAAGDGGNFEDVTVSGITYTYGDFADGLMLQTVGGGGGQGGAGDVQRSISMVRSFFALGGSGGSGGDGGDITYTFNDGGVATRGFASNGMVLQSIGGGGGQGGSGGRLVCARINLGGGVVVPPNLPDDGTLSPEQRCAQVPALRTVDGQGGTYGNGGTINLAGGAVNSLTVHTTGAHSHGIVAQSIGGGGGMGAIGSTPVIDASGDPNSTTFAPTSYRVDVELGASSKTGNGKGARGGDVTLDSVFSISTSGKGSAGVLAQSIGAGGGVIAVDGITDIKMGAGSLDDSGGAVSIFSRQGTLVMTTGESAHGLVAQSVGGGGGFVTGALGQSGLESPTDRIYVAIGNTQYPTGSGGPVSVIHDGGRDAGQSSLISTNGDQSRGIIAQSIGGGGGIYSGVKAGSAGPVVGVPVRLGGSNQAVGGSASVTLRQAIITNGIASDGVVVQSIGGGGGIADLAARPTENGPAGIDIHLGETSVGKGNGGTAKLAFDGSYSKDAIVTSGRQAYGALVQSVGGGGGLVTDSSDRSTGVLKLGNSDGGSGNNDGDGGYVNVGDYTSTVATMGDDAHAIVAQSVGGGGGVGRVQGSDTGSGAALTLGYNGANFGNGGNVDLKMGGPVSTSGDRAFGLVAQSIGGGGGIASAGAASGTGSLQLGGSNGSNHGAANGGTVNVTWVQGNLQTTGDGSHGIIAQSIGGGGGIGGDITFDKGATLNVFGDPSVGGGLSGVGNAAAVTITAQSNISVSGAGAYGVIAQSIGGGGGLGGARDYAFAGRTSTSSSGASRAGMVKIDQTGGTISARGDKGVGILAQSLGDDFSTQTIQMTVAGTVHGGAGGAGIMAHGGNGTNTISVKGSVTADADENGDKTAISYLGSTTDSNSAMTVNVQSGGNVDGDVTGTYRDGSNFTVPVARMALMAAAAGSGRLAALTLHNSEGGTIQGARSYLADVENDGTLIVGASRSTDTLNIAGEYVQGATGEMVAAAHFADGTRDLVQIKGTATLGGVLMLEPLAVLYGAELTMLTAEGGISGRFSEIHSRLFTFEQRLTDKEISLRVAGAHFNHPDFGLNQQQANVADYLGGLFMARTVSHAGLFGGLEFAARAGGYRAALSRLAPGATLAGEAASFELAQGRFETLLDCSWRSRSYSNGSACLQLIGSGQQIDQSGGGNAFGYDGSAYTVGVAGQVMLTPEWRVGGMIGYETSDYNGHGGYGYAEGGTVFAGLSATRSFGGLSLSAGGVVSQGNFDTKRLPGLTAGNSIARADHDLTSVAGRIRAAYQHDLGVGYVTPMVDLDMIWTSADGYTESGAGELGLTVDDSDEFAFIATPAIEAGRNFDLDGSTQLRLYGRAGVSFSTLDNYHVSTRFTNVAAGSFGSDIAIPDVVGRISAGAQLSGTENLGLDLRYDGAFGSGLTSHAASLRLNYQF